MMDAEVETSEEWKCRVTNSKETRSFVLLFKRFSRLVCRNRAVFAVRVASTARVHRSLFFSTVTLQRSSVWPCWFLEWPHYCFWRSLLISTQTSLEFNYFWVAVFFLISLLLLYFTAFSGNRVQSFLTTKIHVTSFTWSYFDQLWFRKCRPGHCHLKAVCHFCNYQENWALFLWQLFKNTFVYWRKFENVKESKGEFHTRNVKKLGLKKLLVL